MWQYSDSDTTSPQQEVQPTSVQYILQYLPQKGTQYGFDPSSQDNPTTFSWLESRTAQPPSSPCTTPPSQVGQTPSQVNQTPSQVGQTPLIKPTPPFSDRDSLACVERILSRQPGLLNKYRE